MALLMDTTNEDDDDDVEHIHFFIVHRQGQKSVNTEEHGVVFYLVCAPLQNENTKRKKKPEEHVERPMGGQDATREFATHFIFLTNFIF
jgi:hypothetical protein